MVGNGGVGLENQNEVGRRMAKMADTEKGILRCGDLTSAARRIEFAEKRRQDVGTWAVKAIERYSAKGGGICERLVDGRSQ